MAETLLLLGASLVTAAFGALGGLGGAVLLVPTLVVAGIPVSAAAPLGLASVAALSVASGPRQLRERSVNHRLGITTEVVASTGAVAGAVVSNAIPERALVLLLAVVALGAAMAGGRRSGIRNLPDPLLGPEDVGERVGSLAGAYPLAGAVAPYRVVRLPLGLELMGLAGLVAGSSGTSGGFIKTPATSEVMHVPTKVAAATTTFTIGITAAAALAVYALQGRIDPRASGAVILGSLLGGRIGAALQSHLSPMHVRRVLSIVLLAVAIVLVVWG